MIKSKFHVNFTSFENASLLRKLTIFYFLISIVPVAVLYYIYMQMKEFGNLTLTTEDLSLTLIFVVIGVWVGYISLRSMIIKVMDISKRNRDALEHILGPEKVRNLSSSSNNEVVLLAQSFNEITSHLEQSVRDLELAKRTLHSVLEKIGEGISSMENIDAFLDLILETVTEALQCAEGVLFLWDPKGEEFFTKSAYGRKSSEMKKTKISARSGIFDSVLDAKQPMVLDAFPKEGALSNKWRAPMLCAPLLLHDTVLGIIAVHDRRSDLPFSSEDKTLLNNVALQTAVALENSKLNEDAEKTYFETISALALAVEAKDLYSRGHSERVATLGVQVAQKLNMSDEEIALIRDAAKLHDLGKIGVTDEVLKKEGLLTAQEKEMMKKHPEIGEGIIKPIRSLRNLSDIVRHHHEKLDGSGYPDGLRGDQISLPVRVLIVADIFDALTSDRQYRVALDAKRAIAEMHGMKEQLDQKVVDALAQIVT